MRKFNLLWLFMMFFVINGFSQFQLNTVPPLNGGNGQNGVTFNVTANQTLMVDTIFVSFTGTGSAEVWYNPNPINGAPTINAANGWVQLVSNAPITTAVGVGNIQPIPAQVGLIIPAGLTYGFYVGGPSLAYSNGTAGVASPYSDANMTIECGNLVGYGGPAPNPTFHVREFNGGIKYTVVGGSNDAAVLSVDSPTVFCSGSQNIAATIGNYGVNQIDSVDVHWEIDGVAQPTFQYIGLLDTIGGNNPNTAQVILGSYNFPSGLTEIKVYTSNPNGVADTSNYNDTTVIMVGPALNGIYTVNPANPTGGTNFNSIADMNYALNTFGVCGPTTINVANGTYNEAIYLDNVPGLNAANHLTIDGGDSSQTILSQSAQYATLTFNGSPNVHVKNMTLEQSGTSGDAVIFSNGSEYDTLSSCVTRVDANSTSSVFYNISFSSSTTSNSTGVDANYNVVQNNRIIGGYYAIRIYGSTANLNTYNQFLNNEIDSAYYYGIYAYYQDSIEIVDNSINMLSRANINADGVYSLETYNPKLVGNYIWADDFGAYISTGTSSYVPVTRRAEIINNMIYSSGDLGLYLYYVDQVDMFHNSISVEGTSPAVQLYATASGPISQYDVRNNIFRSENSEALITNEPDTIFDKLDFNDYYTVNGTDLLSIDGTGYADLLAYQTANTSLNINSIEGDPQFVTNSDMRIIGAFVNDNGDNTVGVTVDIEGDTRPMPGSSTVDMGADEFNPPTCPPVASFVVDSIKGSSAIAYFTPNTLGSVVEYEIVSCGAPQGSGSVDTTTSDSILITGLTSSSCYEIYIREACSRGDTSIWAGPYSFSTPIAGPTGVNCITGVSFPMFDDEFDDLSAWTGDIGTGATIGDWNSNSGGTGSVNTGPSGAHSGTNYAYVETSGNYGQTASIISPMIDLSAARDSAEMSFWIHAYGADIGTLNVNVANSPTGPFTTVFTTSGQLQQAETDPFINVGVRLDSYIGQQIYVEFEYIIGNGLTSDIAIDKLEINTCITCPPPSNLDTSNVTASSASLDWTENGSASQWQVDFGNAGYTLGNGDTIFTATKPVVVSGLNSSTPYEFYVRSICGPGDTSAWVGPFSFSTSIAPPRGVNCITGFPSAAFAEEFDDLSTWTGDIGTGATAGDWNSRTGGTGSLNTGPSGAHSGSNYAYVETSGNYGQTARIVSPMIDLSTAQDSAELSFWLHAYGATIGTFNVNVSTSPTGPFITIFSTSGEIQQAETDPYVNVGVRLDSYVGQQIYLQLEYTIGSTFTGDIAIDQLEINTCVTCPAPTDLGASNATLSTADLDWTENGSATEWQIEFGTTGYSIGSGDSVITTQNPFTLGGLASSTTYDYYVRSICGPGDTSIWMGPFTFNTAIGIPFEEDFESFPAGITNNPFPNGWTTTAGGTVPRWESEDASGANENSTDTGPFYDNTTFGTSGGMYMFLECSGGSLGDNDTLTSASVFIDSRFTTIELSFAYHMYGQTMGDLEVYVESNGTLTPVTTISGQQQTAGSDPWVTYTTFLSGYNNSSVRLKFVGVRGSNYYSDMSIDDIVLDSVPNLNAGVSRVVSPSAGLCAGAINPVIEVFNGGTTDIDSVNIYWDVNGVVDSMKYIGFIGSGTTENVTLPILNISASQIYNVKFYTGLPNGSADEKPSDDMLELNGLRAGFVGTYTLDPSQAASLTNYTSFDALTQDLSNYGICGPTTVNVAAGTYTDDLYISNIPGASSSNYLVIDGGDSSQTIISQGSQYASLTFDDVQHVKVMNMTIEQTSTSGDAVIFSNGSRYDTLSNCVTRVDVNSTSSAIYNISFSSSTTSNSTGVDANYNVVQNNRIIGGYYAIRIYGSTGNLNTYNQILNNEIDSAYYYGIYTYYQDSLEVVGNSINMLSRANTNADGIYMINSYNPRVDANYVWAGDYGVYVSSGTGNYAASTRRAQFVNNMIYSESDYGLYLYYVDRADVWHNSIHVEGTVTPALQINASTSAPISEYDVRNNILSSVNTEALETSEPDTIFIKLDYNVYNSNGPVLINIDGVGYATLAGYQSVQPSFNTASLEGNPQFVSNTDLHILGSFVDGQADATLGITEDIDGDSRPMLGSTTVDIGADEFDPPSCPRPLNFTYYNSSIDSVTVAWDGNISAGDYEIEIVNCGDPQGSGTASTISGDSVILGGLTPNLCYEIYVREICARGDTSLWADPFKFGLRDSCESFDNYVLGPVDEQSILIDGWDNAPGDAEVSNDYASSGSNSLKIHDSGPSGYSDVVANLDTYTSGKWNISIDFLIPQGNGGYYNILHNYLGGGGSVWAIETYLDASGVATVNEGTNGTGVIGTYNFTPGAWNSISHIIDLDNDTAYLLINSVPTNVGWQFSLGAPNGNQFNAFNFFSAANAGQTPLMYFDNFCIKAYEEAPIDGAIVDLTAPLDDGLQCYTSTEAVSVRLINAGLDSLDFTVDTAEVTMVISGAASQTLSFTVSDNTLNGGLPLDRGESIEVPLGSFDMSTIGTYYFDAIVDITADGVQTNDAYSDSITTQAVEGGMVSDNDSICAGDTTTITLSSYYGAIQWQEFDGTAWVDIIGANEPTVDVDPMNTTEYRALVCGTDVSDTVEVYVTNIQFTVINNPTVVACDSTGTDTLIATTTMNGVEFTWYDAPVDGNIVHEGDTLLFTGSPSSTNQTAADTFYVSGNVGGSGGGAVNIAPQATVTASTCNTGACSTLNDLFLGTCGTQEMWISTSSPPSTVAGTNWIEWNFTQVQSIDSLIIHHGSGTTRSLTGATVQYWDGSNWVTHGSFTNLPQQCINRVFIGTLKTDRFRITSFEMNGAGQTSNPNFREIEVIKSAGCESPRQMVIASVDCPVGLEDNAAVAGNIEVYPNPSNGLFTLNITTEQEENFVLSVRDVQGKLIYEENLTVNGAHRDDLDLVGLAKGVYYLQIQNDQATKVEKLIIQ